MLRENRDVISEGQPGSGSDLMMSPLKSLGCEPLSFLTLMFSVNR